MHLYTKFQVSSSTRFRDTLMCSQKIWGSRDLGHAPFQDFSLLVFDILQLCVCTKFQVSSSTHFGDKLGCTPKFMGSRDLSYAPFLDFFAVLDILPLCVCVPNFNFLALLTLIN